MLLIDGLLLFFIFFKFLIYGFRVFNLSIMFEDIFCVLVVFLWKLILLGIVCWIMLIVFLGIVFWYLVGIVLFLFVLLGWLIIDDIGVVFLLKFFILVVFIFFEFNVDFFFLEIIRDDFLLLVI